MQHRERQQPRSPRLQVQEWLLLVRKGQQEISENLTSIGVLCNIIDGECARSNRMAPIIAGSVEQQV